MASRSRVSVVVGAVKIFINEDSAIPTVINAIMAHNIKPDDPLVPDLDARLGAVSDEIRGRARISAAADTTFTHAHPALAWAHAHPAVIDHRAYRRVVRKRDIAVHAGPTHDVVGHQQQHHPDTEPAQDQAPARLQQHNVGQFIEAPAIAPAEKIVEVPKIQTQEDINVPKITQHIANNEFVKCFATLLESAFDKSMDGVINTELSSPEEVVDSSVHKVEVNRAKTMTGEVRKKAIKKIETKLKDSKKNNTLSEKEMWELEDQLTELKDELGGDDRGRRAQRQR